jgi:hypothetical protein
LRNARSASAAMGPVVSNLEDTMAGPTTPSPAETEDQTLQAQAQRPWIAPEIMTRIELQRFLRIEKDLFYKVQSGAHPIPGFKIGDSIRFSKTAVLSWLSACPPYKVSPADWMKAKSSKAAKVG